jgi:phosphoenolpyruvate synthase/pyruvate phosphate dikinase
LIPITIQEGDKITIDGSNGCVYAGEMPVEMGGFKTIFINNLKFNNFPLNI